MRVSLVSWGYPKALCKWPTVSSPMNSSGRWAFPAPRGVESVNTRTMSRSQWKEVAGWKGFYQKALPWETEHLTGEASPWFCVQLFRWPSSHSPLSGTHSPASSSSAPTPPTTRHLEEHVILQPTAKDDLY